MYQRSDLKNLYDRLKAQYPQYGLDFSGDRLTMTRLTVRWRWTGRA